ncbi:Hypothetical_protein [Hexamita inflata]|uniref:Hypothetical_protein n=1 Tax=Hexamita inflata TaxID=28002 RepID=A0AA86NUU2_9EUKA|nr:Hypothetical protein HINF_LOCUS14622 [Hexamita inflata]
MLFMKLFLQTQVDCFSSSSVSLSYQTLFGISLQYAQNCIPDLTNPNIIIDVRIMRPDMLMSCSYDNLQLNSSLNLNCSCEPVDSICKDYQKTLNQNLIGINQNQFIQQELSSFTFEIQIQITEGDKTYSQSINLRTNSKAPNLYFIFIGVVAMMALILLLFLFIHISFKCKQKGNTIVMGKKVEQTPCPSTIQCTNFENGLVINTIL